jgi:Ni,Fe-hydrogenase III large subunit
LYSEYKKKCTTTESGDVLARFYIKAQEVKDSLHIIQAVIAKLEDGPVSVQYDVKDGYALSMIEAPRGESIHWLYIKNGKVDRYKIRTASFCNWQAIEHAVIGNIPPDFPLINKSMNLSYAGTDL